MVKNLPANAGASGDPGSIRGSGKSSGGGNGNPLQYSCRHHPIDRGAWWSTVHGGHKEPLVTEQEYNPDKRKVKPKEFLGIFYLHYLCAMLEAYCPLAAITSFSQACPLFPCVNFEFLGGKSGLLLCIHHAHHPVYCHAHMTLVNHCLIEGHLRAPNVSRHQKPLEGLLNQISGPHLSF